MPDPIAHDDLTNPDNANRADSLAASIRYRLEDFPPLQVAMALALRFLVACQDLDIDPHDALYQLADHAAGQGSLAL